MEIGSFLSEIDEMNLESFLNDLCLTLGNVFNI